MSRGGRREGAGRKRSPNVTLSLKARAAAAATGILPHEFLLSIARGEAVEDHKPSFAERVDAAKAAAPYYAPRLARIDATVKRPGVTEMSEAEIDQRIALALAGEKEAPARAGLTH